MSDIIERLHKLATAHPEFDEVLEAADEIELLRARLAYLEERWQKLRELMDE